MKYVQFYDSYINNQPSHKIGCDGVLVVDGRLSNSSILALVKDELGYGKFDIPYYRKGIIGFMIMKGETYSKSYQISDYYGLNEYWIFNK